MESVHRLMAEKTGDGGKHAFSPKYLGYVLLLLAAANVLNYMDRLLLPVLLPEIKKDIALNDKQLGLITGFAFAVFYASFGLPLARLADTWSRRNIIAGSLIVWSVMASLTGAAQNFLHLVLARIGLGIGEAGCIPASHSLLSDYFSPSRRPGAFAIYSAGATVGVIAGLALGGLLSGSIGWRLTFVVLGAPGILLSIVIFFTLTEPPHGHADGFQASPTAPSMKKAVLLLWARKSFRNLLWYFAVMSLAVSGFSQWIPSFYSRSFQLSQSEIGILFGLVFGLGSTVGILAGGYLGNRLMRNDPKKVVTLCIFASLVAFPCWLGMTLSPWAGLSLCFNLAATIVTTLPSGPAIAMVQGVVPPRVRATATASIMFAASILGMGVGPFVIGLLSDFLTSAHGDESLRYALSGVSIFTLAPVMFLWTLRKTLSGDMTRQDALAQTSSRATRTPTNVPAP